MRRAAPSLALATLAVLGISLEARASTNGIIGYSGQQVAYCTQCHSVGGGAVPTVAITGPNTLAAGAMGTYTFTVTGGPGVRVGVNIATDSATAALQAITANTRNTGGEIHHNIPLTPSGGSMVVQFRLVAPPTSGTVRIYAAGNSTNGNATTGDRSAVTSFPVTITGGINQAPTIFTPAASSASPVTGSTTTLSVLGADDAAESGLTYTWSATTSPSPVTFSVNGTNGAKNTVASFSGAGTYQFNVVVRDAGNLTTNSTVSVTVNPVVTTIVVTPGAVSIAALATQQFTALAKNQFGANVAPQPTYTWSTTGGGNVNSSGLFTAGAILGGPNAITALGGGRSGSASVTIIGGTNQSPTVAAPASASPSVVAGTTTVLTAIGADDNGEASLSYTWAATAGPGGVTFSANGNNAAKNTIATFSQPGAYTFTVTIRDPSNASVTSMTSATVNATLASIVVTPATATVNPSATQQFTGSARDQFGTALATQPALTWTTSGGGTLSAAGLFTAGAAAGGPFVITAASSAISGTASVSVGAGSPPTVATPAAASPATVIAKTANLSVLGADNGGEPSLTYTWSTTTAPAPVSFSVNGTNAARATVATFTRAGSYAFLVTIRDLTNATVTSAVSVTVEPTLTTVAVTPAVAGIGLGGTQQFTAAASDQFSNTIAPSPAFTWTTTGGGTLSATGLFAAANVAGGPFTVTATSAGTSGTASVTVAAGTAPTLAQPAKAAPAAVTKTSTTLSVLGADDGTEAALVYAWAMTSGPAEVTFSANGSNAAKTTVATFRQAGAYQLTVTVKDVLNLTTFSTVDVVVSQTLTALTVSPAAAMVQAKTTQQFAADGADQFGLQMPPAAAVSWLLSGGGTISATGLFTAGSQVGAFSVIATSGDANGTASFTVTPGAIDSSPPVVALTTPAAPQTVTGDIVLEANASDDVAVVEVQFKVDGALIGTATAAPWRFTWDTRKIANGSHQLEAVGRDAAGNLGLSRAVIVQVENTPASMAGGSTAQGGCTSGGASLAPFALLGLLGLMRRQQRRARP